jgi:hypothetical protein
MRFWSAFWLLPALLVACGDKSAVSLSADVTSASVKVEDTAFGAALSGSFALSLALGPEASGPTHVTLGNFSLQTAGGAALIDVLNLQSTPTFPVDVAKGGSQTVSFTFDQDSVDRAALCAGQVRIVGSVMDSLKGGTDPISSFLITPDCDPT